MLAAIEFGVAAEGLLHVAAGLLFHVGSVGVQRRIERHRRKDERHEEDAEPRRLREAVQAAADLSERDRARSSRCERDTERKHRYCARELMYDERGGDAAQGERSQRPSRAGLT